MLEKLYKEWFLIDKTFDENLRLKLNFGELATVNFVAKAKFLRFAAYKKLWMNNLFRTNGDTKYNINEFFK